MTNMLLFIIPELQTLCLASLLLLSFVLPVMAGGLESGGNNTSRSGRRIAWAGQILAGFCGVLILVLPQHSIIWLGTAVVITAVFARKLWRLGSPQL